MLDGFEITMGGEKYIVPPLNLKGLKKVLPLAEKFSDASSEGQMDMATALLQAALVRNYPDMTVEKIEEITEAKEFFALAESIPKLMETSGLAASKGTTENPPALNGADNPPSLRGVATDPSLKGGATDPSLKGAQLRTPLS